MCMVENVKAVLDDLPIKPRVEKNMVAQLNKWFDFNEIKWRPQRYSGASGIPFISKADQLDD
jgi:hypothetical protein